MHRYFRIEYERRFLVSALPQEKPTLVRRIVDRYLDGTRLRLRRMGEELKLTQKQPPRGGQGELTTLYLDEAEYETFNTLPGAILKKTRYSFPPLVIDVFEGALEGLLIAEMECETEAELLSFVPPPCCVREITGDPAYACGHLVRLSAEAARELVAGTRCG